MFDLGTWGEIFIIVVAALVLIGPKELPTVLRALGRMIQKFKNLSAGFRREFDKYIHEGEFEEYTKGANILGDMDPRKEKERAKDSRTKEDPDHDL